MARCNEVYHLFFRSGKTAGGGSPRRRAPVALLALQDQGAPLILRFVAAVDKATEERSTQLALLDELKAAAERLGLTVREERLLREVGYHVRSGRCRLRGDEVIFLERGSPVSAQIDVLVEELAGRALDTVYLSPAARMLVERAATNEARADADKEDGAR